MARPLREEPFFCSFPNREAIFIYLPAKTSSFRANQIILCREVLMHCFYRWEAARAQLLTATVGLLGALLALGRIGLTVLDNTAIVFRNSAISKLKKLNHLLFVSFGEE